MRRRRIGSYLEKMGEKGEKGDDSEATLDSTYLTLLYKGWLQPVAAENNQHQGSN